MSKKREDQLLIRDILDAATKIARYTSRLKFEDLWKGNGV